MRNRVYFFTGSGNSLHAAQEIARSLPDCDVVAICNGADPAIPQGLERVGFVFPTYYWGLSAMVADFLRKASFPNQGTSYYFAIATCAGMAGNALPQVKKLLQEHETHLDFSASVRMAANAVFNYDMTDAVDKATEKSDRGIQGVIPKIVNKKKKRTGGIIGLLYRPYLKSMGAIHTFDENLNVNDDCISCGICASVCPAANITLEDGRPRFHHQCESCTACIQHCPQRAVNFKDQTQNRRRYTHPKVGQKVIRSYYKSNMDGGKP